MILRLSAPQGMAGLEGIDRNSFCEMGFFIFRSDKKSCKLLSIFLAELSF